MDPWGDLADELADPAFGHWWSAERLVGALAIATSSPGDLERLRTVFEEATVREWLKLGYGFALAFYDAQSLPSRSDVTPWARHATAGLGDIVAGRKRDTLSLALGTMAADGYLRERCLRGLIGRNDPFLTGFFALRTVDNVPVNAEIARTELLRIAQTDTTAFARAVPIIQQLRFRRRIGAVERSLYELARGSAARQNALLAAGDAGARRLGFELALESGTLSNDELVELALRSRDVALAARAARAVVATVDEHDPMIAILLRGRPTVRRAVLESLPPNDPNAERAKPFLLDRSPIVRSAAQGVLIRSGQSPLPFYREVIVDPARRARALLELGSIGTSEDVPAIRAALHDRVPRVRRSAAEAFAARLGPAGIPMLQLLLADPVMAAVVGRVLAPHAAGVSRSAIDEAIGSPDPGVRYAGLGVLRAADLAGRLEADLRALGDEDERIREKGDRDLPVWFGKSVDRRLPDLERRRRLAALVDGLEARLDPKLVKSVRFAARLRPQDLA